MRIRAHRLAAALLAVALVLGLAACTPSASSEQGAGPSTTAGVPATRRTPKPPECPNPDGQYCRGALSAGRTYTSRVFTPQLTYRVPNPGWSNQEDRYGNFLLLPPQNDLAGVDAGTSDFLGVYTAITPGRITRSEGCVTATVPHAGDSPATMAAWFVRQPDLVVSRPDAVRVGGLKGVVVDLRTKAGARHSSCVENGHRIELAGLFSGVRPSFLDHAVSPGVTMRLYLLGYDVRSAGATHGHVLGIELDDVAAAPGDLAQLTTVAKRLVFTP